VDEMKSKVIRKLKTAKTLYRIGGITLILKTLFKKYILKKMSYLLEEKLGFSAVFLLFSRGNLFENRGIIISQKKGEILTLLEILKGVKVKNVLEIGTYKGGTALLFSEMLNANVVTIDVKVPLLRRKILEYVSNGRIKIIIGNSRSYETLEKVRKMNKAYDALFIDADHSYEGVRRDFEIYSQLVKKGGAIALHDIILINDVKKFWSEIKKAHPFIEILDNDPYGIGVIFK
jgi:predicted O-methyltransferase YrrM